MYWVLPGMDVMWGIFTLLQYRADSYAELMAYRFSVGWFEVNISMKSNDDTVGKVS
jgi:MFS transporter, ACS family, DAL5 transporter family protein